MYENEILLEQHLKLSGKQILSLEILSYTNEELEEFMLKEYLENPMLENSINKQGKILDSMERMYEEVHAKSIPIEEEIRNSLLEQLNRNDFTDKEWETIEYLIQCLDEKGFFCYEPGEIAPILGCQEDFIEKCLNRLKTLEPTGIFSKDWKECIKKQLEVSGEANELLFQLIDEYVEELLEGKLNVVSRKLHLSTAQIKEYMHTISKYNPKPFMNLHSGDAEYIVPDILVEREQEQWKIILSDCWMGEYKYNDYYIHMMKVSKDVELKHYFQKKLERARLLISCIEQRKKTIRKIVEVILQLQEDYFLKGMALRPMKLEDVAVQTGLHISTVSRAISGKYLQYKKVILVKDLFSTAPSANNISENEIKKVLVNIIQTEDKKCPLSDQKIVEKMAKAGYAISRRTVNKYRTQLDIPDSRKRQYLYGLP